LAKVGVRIGGTGTTRLAGAFDLRKPLEPMLGRMIQSMIDKGYRDFIGKVAEARARSEADVDDVARGRVWSGQQALERGLVDELGGLRESIAAAASRAGLEPRTASASAMSRPSLRFRAFRRLAQPRYQRAGRWPTWAPLAGPLPLLPIDPATRTQLARELPWLTPPPAGSRPMRSLAHCFCRL
jgi:protease IV